MEPWIARSRFQSGDKSPRSITCSEPGLNIS